MGESEWIISKQPFFLSQSYSYNICDWMKKLWKIKSHTFLFIIIIYFSVHSYIYILVAKWKSMKNIDHIFLPTLFFFGTTFILYFFLGHGKLTTPTLFGG